MNPVLRLLAVACAAAAIVTAAPDAPPRFARRMLNAGHDVISAEAIGREWPCARPSHPTDDELCYAVLTLPELAPVTGP